MKVVINQNGYDPIITKFDRLPVPGSYYALITGVETQLIEPFYDEQETCLLVTYKLVHTETLEAFEFQETYYPYNNNPRAEDFLAFLKTYGYDFTSDDDLIGLKATLEVTYEVFGGMAHPVISYRPWGISQALHGITDETAPF